MRFFFSFCLFFVIAFCFSEFSHCLPGGEQNASANQVKTSGGKFEQSLHEYLTGKLSDYASWNIQEIQPNGKIQSFDGFSVDTLRPLTVNGTFIYVPVTIESKSGKLKSLLTLRMKLRKMALVAIHEIQVNTDLQVSDFVQQEVDATGLRGSLITDYTELTRLKSKMHIKSGSYLTDQMIRRRSLIKHGDPILCYVSNSSVVVSLDCIARDDGNPGEIIHVMSRDKHVYRAKIETEQTARIIE